MQTKSEPKILPSQEFDTGTATATPDIKTLMYTISEEAKANGLDIQMVIDEAKSIHSLADAKAFWPILQRMATILFLQWQRIQQSLAEQEGDASLEGLALARLFNGVTYSARDLHQRFDLIDTSHLDELEDNLRAGANGDKFDPKQLATVIDKVAKTHTHEKAWPWVVLPTFARQPYGRILLRKVNLDSAHKMSFVTQPFFLAGRTTLLHTHGQNWAFAQPLGKNGSGNTHINTLWMPRTTESPFPLVLLDEADYRNTETAVIPPRLIHGISRRAFEPQAIPSLTEMLADSETTEQLIAQSRFGEMSCLHIYRPCQHTSKQLTQAPIVIEDERFFIENDMIVFDHNRETIWSGGGGSWPRRMIEFGTTGEHCGLCFAENDPRRENLDPVVVSEWFVQDPPPSLMVFRH